MVKLLYTPSDSSNLRIKQSIEYKFDLSIKKESISGSYGEDKYIQTFDYPFDKTCNIWMRVIFMMKKMTLSTPKY